MDILKELVRNIVVIVLLTTFLDLLLPSSSMQRFVKVVMGLFILVALLNPILELLSRGQDFEVFSWQHTKMAANSSVLLGRERLNEVNEQLFRDNYRQRLEKQMETFLKLVEGAEGIQVQVTLKNEAGGRLQEGLASVRVTVNNREGGDSTENIGFIEPIRIQVGDSGENSPAEKVPRMAATREEKETVREIKQLLCQYFSLQPDQITVVFS